jgi:hypothetical protein
LLPPDLRVHQSSCRNVAKSNCKLELDVEGPKVVGKKRKLGRRCMSDYSHTLYAEGRGFNVWASYYENQIQALFLLQTNTTQFVH